jgi:hypothetical protein
MAPMKLYLGQESFDRVEDALCRISFLAFPNPDIFFIKKSFML